jgi:hypothetical protein
LVAWCRTSPSLGSLLQVHYGLSHHVYSNTCNFLWNHVCPNDEKWYPVVRISFGWDNQYRGKALTKHHGFSYPPLLDLENHWPCLRNSSHLLGAVCTSNPKQQTPSAFHTPNEHNLSHKKRITHKRIRTAEEIQ